MYSLKFRITIYHSDQCPVGRGGKKHIVYINVVIVDPLLSYSPIVHVATQASILRLEFEALQAVHRLCNSDSFFRIPKPMSYYDPRDDTLLQTPTCPQRQSRRNALAKRPQLVDTGGGIPCARSTRPDIRDEPRFRSPGSGQQIHMFPIHSQGARGEPWSEVVQALLWEDLHGRSSPPR